MIIQIFPNIPRNRNILKTNEFAMAHVKRDGLFLLTPQKSEPTSVFLGPASDSTEGAERRGEPHRSWPAEWRRRRGRGRRSTPSPGGRRASRASPPSPRTSSVSARWFRRHSSTASCPCVSLYQRSPHSSQPISVGRLANLR